MRSSATYFRLSRFPNTLPTHWAYGDPWDYEHDDDGRLVYTDYRVKGFQVWASLANVIVAAAGWHHDGDYPISDYPWFFTLESQNCRDGCGEWYSVDEFQNLRACDTASLVRWCVEQSECGLDLDETGNQQDEFDALGDWIEENEADVLAWINANSTPIEAERIDTLGYPGQDCGVTA